MFNSREQKLLLACVRWSLGAAPVSGIAPLAENICDWQPFLDLAREDGLLPLVSDALNGINPPRPVAEVLDRALRENAKLVLLMSNELVRLARLFDDAHLRTVALKGPVLAHECYAEPADRTMSDLDLLVGPFNLKPAIRLLSEAGYIEAGCIDAADEHLRACHEVFRRWYNALGFRHPASGVRVDLHWAFAPAGFPGNPDAADFMRQAGLTLLQGYPVRSLAPEDNLVFLCAHGAKHAWAGLNWVVDICGLIRRSTGFRYDRVLAGCGRSPALKRMVWIGLLLADFVLDGAEPALAEFCRHAPSAARRSAVIFLDRFASGPGAKNGAQDRLSSRLRLPYAVSGSARASAAYVLAQIIAPQEADWNSWRIGWRPAFFLYYPWRLARLGWKWRPRLIRESAGTL